MAMASSILELTWTFTKGSSGWETCWDEGEDEGTEDFPVPLLFHKVYLPHDSSESEDDKQEHDIYHCVSMAEDSIPSYLGNGVGKRTFFELEYTSEFDYENYVVKLWDPVELRTPKRADENLRKNPLSLFAGKILTLPYSVPGTALFSTWIPPFDGPDNNSTHYGPFYKGNPAYGPVVVRSGLSAVIKLTEEGTQTLDQGAPVYYYLMNLDSLSPEVKYPNIDTSYIVTIAFIWNSDETFYYQNVLQITNVGMAALLITSIASAIVAISDGTAIYIDYEERNQKS